MKKNKISAIAGAFLAASCGLFGAGAPAHAQEASAPALMVTIQEVPTASWTSERFTAYFRDAAAINSAALASRFEVTKELLRVNPKASGAVMQAARDVFEASEKRKTWVQTTGLVAWIGQSIPLQRDASRETLELMLPKADKLLANPKTDLRRVGADIYAQAGIHPDLGVKALEEMKPLLNDESQATRCTTLMNMAALNNATHDQKLARSSFLAMVPMFYQLGELQEDLSVCIVENGSKIALDGGASVPQLSGLLQSVKADETLPPAVREMAATYSSAVRPKTAP